MKLLQWTVKTTLIKTTYTTQTTQLRPPTPLSISKYQSKIIFAFIHFSGIKSIAVWKQGTLIRFKNTSSISHKEMKTELEEIVICISLAIFWKSKSKIHEKVIPLIFFVFYKSNHCNMLEMNMFLL